MEEEGAQSGKECCDILASGHEHKAAMATHNRLQTQPTFIPAGSTNWTLLLGEEEQEREGGE